MSYNWASFLMSLKFQLNTNLFIVTSLAFRLFLAAILHIQKRKKESVYCAWNPHISLASSGNPRQKCAESSIRPEGHRVTERNTKLRNVTHTVRRLSHQPLHSLMPFFSCFIPGSSHHLFKEQKYSKHATNDRQQQVPEFLQCTSF